MELNPHPETIEMPETEQDDPFQAMCDPGFYKTEKSQTPPMKNRVESL